MARSSSVAAPIPGERGGGHAAIRSRLGAYLDGELSRWKRWKVDNHLRQCPDCAVLLRELHEVDQALLNRALASPFRTAEAFGVEDIIDPRDTRRYLCRFIDAAQGRQRTLLGPKLRAGVLP